jgi:hypothetical protein
VVQDPIALKEMYEAQKQMEQWAVSKNKPGQFLGSTGAKVLPKHEFNTGIQAYAKKEQFTKAERVSEREKYFSGKVRSRIFSFRFNNLLPLVKNLKPGQSLDGFISLIDFVLQTYRTVP